MSRECRDRNIINMKKVMKLIRRAQEREIEVGMSKLKRERLSGGLR